MMETLFDTGKQPTASQSRTMPYMDTEFKRFLFDLVQAGFPSWMIALLVGSTISAIDTIATRHGLRRGYHFRKCMTCPEWFGSSDRRKNHRCYLCQQRSEGLL